jgi:hypothetical protein|tara:strand:- start:401 stop:1156 length:756 start_codon:yes stop_codon:yes gene_type:complete
MTKKLRFNLNYLYVIVGVLIIYGLVHFFINQKFDDELNKRDRLRQLNNLPQSNHSSYSNNYETKEDYDNIISLRPDERKLKSLDRVFNPLEYPFQSTPYYNNSWYPSYGFAPQIIGCGRRRIPCYGDAQQVIDNNYPSRCINNQNIAPVNIAPVNIRTRGPRGEPQQVGTLFNLTPGNKDVLPLFGRQKFPNDGKWEYYTIIGRHSAKVPVKPLRNYQEVGTNDILQLVNYPGNFQATVYKRDDLEYIPYI